MLIDEKARNQAIDPGQSFIIQAPAGSGKTELLTQRFLKLLGIVENPEQIIAITFTRKAASEMRSRVINAIVRGKSQEKPDAAHEQNTWRMAKEVLKQDKRMQWKLLEHPNRLQIKTIDSLCNSLTARMPLLSKTIPYAKISDDVKTYYEQAAKNCIAYALSNTELKLHAINLLSHVDNNPLRLNQLLIEMCAKRDQWLPYILRAKSITKGYLDSVLEKIKQHALSHLKLCMPVNLSQELCACAIFAANNIEQSESNIKTLTTIDSVNLNHMNFEQALGFADLLLTSEGNIRKTVTKKEGFPAPSAIKDKDKKLLFSERKNQFLEILRILQGNTEFALALQSVRTIPQERLSEKQWDVLQSLISVLPLLAAHLNLIFSQNACVDFSAISEQAALALGDDETPTDLTLYLDNQIQHILIDEFQDTSIHQYKLLEQLTRGWEIGDGRTLFIVGDPMQSIYRFREAEVGLFLHTKLHGIGEIKPKSLELRTNFRSSKTIVDWVNNKFKTIFPKNDDIESGAISYLSSEAINDATENDLIRAYQCEDRENQANIIIKEIKQLQKSDPNQSIGILVRTRSQLTEIIAALREHQLPFQGVDIENLSTQAIILDVYCLTEALLFPSNRLVWLSFLRSSLCGIKLADLHKLALYESDKSIVNALSNINKINGLSEDALSRLKKIIPIMQQALRSRQHSSLSAWVINCFENLGGQQLLKSEDGENLEQFWSLLDKYDEQGIVNNTAAFAENLTSLYSQQSNAANIHIMTIHKSKGLEFDSVILPCLNEVGARGDTPLIQWIELSLNDGDNALLISPIKASDEKPDPWYKFIAQLNKQKEQYEAQRLLYVAATRAKKRLILTTASQKPFSKNSFSELLGESEFDVSEPDEVPITQELANTLHRLSVIPNKCLNPQEQINHNLVLNCDYQSNKRLIGIFVHQQLQSICDNHYTSLDKLNDALWPQQLYALGIESSDIEEVMDKVKSLLAKVFNDSVGRWIISPHLQEKTEYELLVKQENKYKTYIIDRTFIEYDIRWIIDFKTGKPSDLINPEYKKQLDNYAELFTHLENRKTKCGLYYPLNQKFQSWDFMRNHTEAMTSP
jgi:ATP-dependent exoDNAse (exonuclease V) beta subunit